MLEWAHGHWARVHGRRCILTVTVRLLSKYIPAHTIAHTAPMRPVRAFTRMGAWARVGCTCYRTTATPFCKKLQKKNETGDKQWLIGRKATAFLKSQKTRPLAEKCAPSAQAPVCAVCTSVYFVISCVCKNLKDRICESPLMGFAWEQCPFRKNFRTLERFLSLMR